MGFGNWEDAEPGVKRYIHAPGSQLMMMEVRFQAGAQGYEHSHPHEQMSYCLYGRIEFAIDGEKQIVEAGQSVRIPPNARHGVTALEKSALLDVFTPLREDLLNR